MMKELFEAGMIHGTVMQLEGLSVPALLMDSLGSMVTTVTHGVPPNVLLTLRCISL